MKLSLSTSTQCHLLTYIAHFIDFVAHFSSNEKSKIVFVFFKRKWGLCDFTLTGVTLVKVYVDLLVFTRIASTSYTGSGSYWC